MRLTVHAGGKVVVSALVVVALFSAASAAGTGPGACIKVPTSLEDPETGRTLVVIPPDWQEYYPYSERYNAPLPGLTAQHVIDLNAIRFVTDTLVVTDLKGKRRFLPPDTSSFPPGLIKQAFADGATDLFLVQAASAAGQVALRSWIERNRIEIVDYIPDMAYLVRLNALTWGQLPGNSAVFWAGLFQPAFRVHPKLDFIIESDPAHDITLMAHFDFAAYRSEGELVDALRGVAEASILDVTRGSRFWLVRFSAKARSARPIVIQPGCLWVERFVERELHNNLSRSSDAITTGRGSTAGPIMDVEDVWDRGIRGEGQIASAADTGLDTGNLATLHWDFGQQGVSTNPLRVIKGYALGRSTWDDPNPNGGHGTHTSGSIVGNGIRSGSTPVSDTYPSTSFAGTAPKAQFVFQSVMDRRGGLTGLPLDLNNLFLPPYTDGARVHSNSWGSAAAGDYTTDCQNLDEFAWNYKNMVITFSAGNSGSDASGADGVINTDSIGAPGTAKNCITVGASENYRPDFVYEYPENDCTGTGFTQQAWGWFNATNFPATPIYADPMANNANGMGAFSSRGPTNDGRFKPDVTAPGIAIISTRTSVNQQYEQWGICNVPVAQRTYYLTMGGTSMANPLTAGTAVLVRQYYWDGWHPNNSATTNASPTGHTPTGEGFDPSAALVKATLINGAWDMAPGQYGSSNPQPEIPPSWDRTALRDLPNNAEGFGRVDLEHSLFPGSGWGDDAARKLEVHDVAAGLQTGQSTNYPVTVAGNANPLIVTLVWTDPYGGISAGTELVNNLDLEVTSPSSVRYYPNRKNWTGGTPDAKNNVEQVYVASPASGAWTVTVRGTSVPGNAQSGSTTQPYALVISGILSTCSLGTPAAPSVSDVNACALSGVQITWSAVSGATAYDLYVDGATIVSGVTSPYTYSPGNTNSHTYQVRARNATCTGAWSTGTAGTDATTPAAPGAPTVSDIDACALSGVQITWSAVSGATAYDLYVDGATIVSGVSSPHTYSPGDSNPHTYQVRGRNTSCTGAWSTGTVGTDATAPSAPAAPSVSDVSACALSGVQITWSPVSGATAYDLYVDGATIVSGVTSPYTYSPGNTNSHTYQVRARNATCTGAWSPATPGADANSMPGTPAAPTVEDLDICALTGVRISWGAVSGATAYDLYVDGTTIVSGVTSPYTYSPGNSTSHTVQVRGRNATCTGSWSTGTSGTDDMTCICSTAPTFAGLTSVTPLTGDVACGLRLAWSAATSNCPNGPSVVYDVYRRTGSDPFALLASCVTGTSYDDISAVTDTTYDYIVRAEDSTSFGGGACNGGNEDGNSITGTGTVASLNETVTQVTSPLTADNDTVPTATTNLSPAFTVVSATSATVSYTSGYTSGGGTVDRFGPDDEPYNSGYWTITGSEQTADHCSHSSNYARINQDQYMTLTNTVSTVGYTNITVVFDWITSAMETGDVLRLDYYNGTAWVTNVWNSYDNAAWHCGEPVALPAGAAGIANLRIRFFADGNAPSGNERAGVDYVIIRGDGSGGSGTWRDNVRVTLIDPSATETVLKGFGQDDGSPYNVLGSYTVPGTYQLRLEENAGGTATLTNGSMNVQGTACVPAGASPLQFLTARASGDGAQGTVKLEWLNSASSYGLTRLCVSTSTYPTDPATCSKVVANDCKPADPTCPSSAGSYATTTHTGLANTGATTYYYTAWVNASAAGTGAWSSPKRVAATPFNAASPNPRKWAYSTGASALAPPGIMPGSVGSGAVFAVSNDRILHGVDPTSAGGSWLRTSPYSWLPKSMNAPAQHQPPVVPLFTPPYDGMWVYLASQDGRVYCVNAHSGALEWPSGATGPSEDLGEMLQAAPAAFFTEYLSTVPNLMFAGTRNVTAANTLCALNPLTGARVPAFDFTQTGLDAIGIITGIAVDYDSERVYFTSRARSGGSSDTVWCVDVSGSSAVKVWSKAVGDIDGGPVLAGGRLYAGTNAGTAVALELADDGATMRTYATGDGPIKGYIWPEWGTSNLYFSTTNRVWSVADPGTGSALTYRWDSGSSVPTPSIPMLLDVEGRVLVGGGDGKLYQLAAATGALAGAAVPLGSAALGPPAFDVVAGVLHIGSTSGLVHAVSSPLPESAVETYAGAPRPLAAPPTEAAEERVPGQTCATLRVSSAQERLGLFAKGFSATKTIDLTVTATLDSKLAGDHVLDLDVFAPDGSLYRTLTVPMTTTKRTPQYQNVTGYSAPLAESVALPDNAAPGQRTVSAALPVAGTDIVSSSLYGSWRVRARLDGAPTPCSTGGDFVLGR